jgi:glutamyl-Q tRNA(Asp) synthetase
MTLTRFAPSPTGLLHLGHAFAAAQAFGFGPCLLRIEDIDHSRSKPEFTDAIFEDLRWLGFDWLEPVRVQSDHLSDYHNVVADLTERGLTYEDYSSRTGSEDRTRPPTIKLNIANATEGLASLTYQENGQTRTFDPNALPDPTLARRDIGTSYHIAVTHDDALQGITDIVRGKDLAGETPIHVLIQTLMGWPIPHYHHHSLIMESDGKKMSKRRGSQTIASLRESGLSATDILALAKARATN